MRRFTLFVFVALLTLMITLPVAAARPKKPVIIEPGGGQIYNTHTPFLEWSEGEGATRYRVTVWNNSGIVVLNKNLPNPGLICLDTICGYSMVNDDIDLKNGKHTWRVIAFNADGNNPSAIETFIIDFPGKPTLTLPLNNDEVGSTPIFRWDEVLLADDYTVVVQSVATGFTFKSSALDGGLNCLDTICEFFFANLVLPSGKYKWWVEARKDTFDHVSRSQKRSFTVVNK